MELSLKRVNIIYCYLHQVSQINKLFDGETDDNKTIKKKNIYTCQNFATSGTE